MLQRLLLLLALCLSAGAHALTADQAAAMAIGESDTRIEALNKAVADADDKTAAFIQALADDAVKTAGGKAFVVVDDKATDPVTGAEAKLPDDAEDVINNNRVRGELDTALAALKLFSKDRAVRAAAVTQLQKDADETKLPLIEKAWAAEQDAAIKEQLALVRAGALLGSSDKARRLEAASLLAASANPATRNLLQQRLQEESDPEVKAALQKSISSIAGSLVWGERAAAAFSG
ncbi:MAG: urea ABC transporter permease subunit UrtB, partial [Comamonadaceae bacterium]